MYDHFLVEMADQIAKELQIDNNTIHSVMSRYWQDKIAHVWQVDDMLESAYRARKPITRTDAAILLQSVFDHHDSSMGISWTNLDVALEDYHFDLKVYPEEKYKEVCGVFNVWKSGDANLQQFGEYPNELIGNLPDAIALAMKMATENPGAEIQIGLEDRQSTERIPWLSVTLLKDQIEPTIKECEHVL